MIALDVSLARLRPGGIHVYITELERALTPIMGDRLTPIHSRLAVPLQPRRSPADRLRTLGRDLWWHQVGVTRAAREAGARVLHLPGGLGPIRRTFPTVLTIHDLTVLRFPELFTPWFRHYSRAVLPPLARSADVVIADSRSTAADIVQQLGVPNQRVRVVSIGVDARFLPATPAQREAIRQRFGLPGDFVLTVGSLEPRKNLPRLIAAIDALRRSPECRDITLVHAGPPGWMMNGAASSPGVRLLGYVATDDLPLLYSAARVFAYPSLYEGFGLPVLEAMACGCPVVTSNVSALPEIALGVAELVDPYSVAAIADGVKTLWTESAERRAQRTARGRERAREYTWERTARETAAVYEALA
jgi:glycosyltransferase involved in cell wall biosynthesis